MAEWKQERPSWCPHSTCGFKRRVQDAMCCGGLPEPEPHGPDENVYRFCLNGADKDGGVFDLQVNDTDLGYFRWIFDALDGKATSWLSRDRDVPKSLDGWADWVEGVRGTEAAEMFEECARVMRIAARRLRAREEGWASARSNELRDTIEFLRDLRAGLSDGPAGPADSGWPRCDGCGHEVWYNVWVDGDVWEKIRPEPGPEGGGGTLCARCIDRRCVGAGLEDVTLRFHWTGEAARCHYPEDPNDG